MPWRASAVEGRPRTRAPAKPSCGVGRDGASTPNDAKMTSLDLSNYAGLVALALLTVNILLGLLISTKYNPVRRWPHRRVNTIRIHNWTGYAALAISFVHPVVLLFSATAGFGVVDLLWPLGAPKQPVINTLGALAFYLLLVVVITSLMWQERKAISRRAWKRFHFTTYALFPLYAVHALLTDPALKDRPLDPLDAEKVFVELCILAVVIGIVLRVRWQREHRPRNSRTSPAAPASVALLLAAGGGLAGALVTAPAAAQPPGSASSGWSYNPDGGPTYRRGDLTYAVWGFAERYWGPSSTAVPADFWRRVRQGMELDLPRAGRVRPVLFYEIDLTDNNFFRAGARTQVFENLYVALQYADDPGKGRILFGENTHVLSREDNLSSGNLPTINRSLVLEEHGSVNSFGTQWGVQASRALTPRLALAVSAQDNRGSLNTARPRYRVGNSLAAKLMSVVIDDAPRGRRLTAGLGGDYTRDIRDRTFTLASAIGAEALAGAPATGSKGTVEGDVALTTRLWGWPVTLEGEALASRFSETRTAVVGGYVQLQVAIVDTPGAGALDPFVRYDIVRLAGGYPGQAAAAMGNRGSASGGSAGAAVQQALRAGFNYSLPRAGNFVSVHAEYAFNRVTGPAVYVSGGPCTRSEVRIGLRANAARYARH